MAVTDKFDISALALKSMFPKNHILMDDQNLPSVMVYIPKFKLSDVIDGASDDPHPAFIVNGEEIDGFYVSKYLNIVHDSRAYSLPHKDPQVSVAADDARTYCENKGDGWHMMSAAEWGAIALWCKNNGFLPYGNNSYGRDTRESIRNAVPTYYDTSVSDTAVGRTATGTGPLTWFHNGQADGIADLNGNVLEWIDGMRLVYGELQILANNNAADSDNSKLASSSAWMAIDGTTGDLIEPDGSGTTDNSLKLDYISGVWTWIAGEITTQSVSSVSHAFVSVTADTDVCDDAKELLYALALLPDDTAFDYEGDYFYAINADAERFPIRGGCWSNGSVTGVFLAGLSSDRTYALTSRGFRSAYYETT